MKNQELRSFIRNFLHLFYSKNDVLDENSAYAIKHFMEEFAKKSFSTHRYISEDMVLEVSKEIGYEPEDGYLHAINTYPSRIDIEKAFSIKLPGSKTDAFERTIHYYDLESLDVEAMTQSYSTALSQSNTSQVFPSFDRLMYESLNIIKIDDNGFLSYYVDEDEKSIILDSIYTRVKKKGIGERLFNMLIKETKANLPEYKILIDAYTDDSKLFFGSLFKKHSFLKKSDHLNKPDIYAVDLQSISY